MTPSLLLILAATVRAEDAPAEVVTPDPPAAEAPPPTTEPPSLGLSVGTGPQPLNTLTLGLTGLAGRVLVPTGPGALFVSFGHTSFRGSNFPEQGFADRDFTRAATTTGMLGYRGGKPPEAPKVVAYGVGGLLVNRAAVSNGDTSDKQTSGVWSAGGLLGVGADGYLDPAVSVGVELGGIAGVAQGGTRFRGETEDKFSGLGLSTFASAQLTVWR